MKSEGETFGPFTGFQLQDYARGGRLDRDTQVVRVGSETWVTAAEDPALARLFATAALSKAHSVATAAEDATVVQVTNHVEVPKSQPILEPGANKSAGLALFLSFIFVGMGQIYNGEVGKGILMFVGCVLLWAVMLGWIINIWSMVDAYSTAKSLRTKYDLWFAHTMAR